MFKYIQPLNARIGDKLPKTFIAYNDHIMTGRYCNLSVAWNVPGINSGESFPAYKKRCAEWKETARTLLADCHNEK